MGEPAVLGLFRVAAGIRNTDIRGHDDIGRSGVCGWVVKVQEERRAVIDLPERDSRSGGSVPFEDCDGGVGIERAVQPQYRDVIFRRANASGVVGRFGKWKEAVVGQQGGG